MKQLVLIVSILLSILLISSCEEITKEEVFGTSVIFSLIDKDSSLLYEAEKRTVIENQHEKSRNDFPCSIETYYAGVKQDTAYYHSFTIFHNNNKDTTGLYLLDEWDYDSFVWDFTLSVYSGVGLETTYYLTYPDGITDTINIETKDNGLTINKFYYNNKLCERDFSYWTARYISVR
ncbi:MAG: hypothetical protein KAI79_09155 [Bacteroidales bacterium]|nr:hypothetical protein [Bacteroidales bacterium]